MEEKHLKDFKKAAGMSLGQYCRKWGLDISTASKQLKRGSCKLGKGWSPGRQADHPLYQTYAYIRTKCYLKSAGGYSSFGARGIRMCGRWFYSFDNFVEDVGTRPEGYILHLKEGSTVFGPETFYWGPRTSCPSTRDTQKGLTGIYSIPSNSKGNRYKVIVAYNKKLQYVGLYSNKVTAFIAKEKYLKELKGD